MRVLLWLVFVWPTLAVAVDVTPANDLFWKGNHLEAAKAYRALAEANPTSADLWYNLGTAEARAGRLGHSVHAFEQALLLQPGDEDVAYNLTQVRDLAAQRGVAGAGDSRVIPPGEDDAGTGLLMAMSEGMLAVSFAATWALLFGLLIVWRRTDRPALRTTTSFLALIMGLLALASGGILAARIYTQSTLEHGVVLARVAVRNGPGDAYPRGVVLAEGVKVRLRGVDGHWRQVTLPDGAEGWLPEADVGALNRP
jgi:hypothetical protein